MSTILRLRLASCSSASKARHEAHPSRCSSTARRSRADSPSRTNALNFSVVPLQSGRHALVDVCLEVRLAQPFASAVGESGDGVGADAEQRGDLRRRASLDVGVPQHHLPPLRQGRVGLRHHRLVFAVVGGPQQHGVDRLRRLVGELDLLVTPSAVVEGVAHRGEQVGTKGEVGALAAAQGAEHLGEALGDEIVGVGPRAHEAAGAGPGCVDVPLVQHGEGCGVAGAGRGDQLCVAERGAQGTGVRQGRVLNRHGHRVAAALEVRYVSHLPNVAHQLGVMLGRLERLAGCAAGEDIAGFGLRRGRARP